MYVQLKPTMRHAKAANGGAVVVKQLRPGSNELQILQYLSSIKSPCNPTIPLLDTLKLDTRTFVILREGSSLHIEIEFESFCRKAVEFSFRFLEAVAFLHHHGIAHLDIKPQNLVIVRGQLFIIDFDLSVHVSGPDALIDRWCGTPKWMAPEIGNQDGPRCSYSPIRADLWSCGIMLQYLANNSDAVKEDNHLKALTTRLLNKNPLLRPLLHLRSSVKLGHSSSEVKGRLKRKPDDLPHDTKRLAIA